MSDFTEPSHRAADAVVEEIENRIAIGRLKDSQALPSERALMEEFGTSRTVIREAITALSNRGLIECKPRHRPVVRRFGFESVVSTTSPVIRQLLKSPVSVKNLYDARVFVERQLARDAAIHANRDDIATLKQALMRNRDAIEDSRLFYDTDRSFHRVLYLISGNPVFTAVHDGFVLWLAPQWERMERLPERNLHNWKAHEAIYNAILERDPDAAEQAVVVHLGDAWEFVRSTFEWDLV